MVIFLQKDGERSHEDDGNAEANRGDLVPLETCGLGVGLRGGLKGQDTFFFATEKSSVKQNAK